MMLRNVHGAGNVKRSYVFSIIIPLLELRLLRQRKFMVTVVLKKMDFLEKLTAKALIIVIVLKDGNI